MGAVISFLLQRVQLRECVNTTSIYSFGSDVSLTNATTVTLSTPGIYLVSYYFQGDPTAGNETISVRLTLNGTQVAGSFIFMLQEVLLY